jgi:hypothetical protein
MFFDSPPDSGYSVDDLAPLVPSSFVVSYNTGSGNTLSWDESPDADFQHFRVYRSSDPNFTPSPDNLAHSTTSTGWVDPDYDGGPMHYKTTALDYSGNESDAADPGTVTAAGNPKQPIEFALHPNAPNPFNPTTVIRYDIPHNGVVVRLHVYDIAGRLVRTLVNETQSAGRKSVTWDGRDDGGRSAASGVYFYRLTTPAFAKTQKMVLLK